MKNFILNFEKDDYKEKYIFTIIGIKLKIRYNLDPVSSIIKLNKPLIKFIDKLIPKDKDKVVFTSYPDFSDSSKIFYDYLISIKQNKFKKIYWIYTKENTHHFSIPDKRYYLYTFSAIYNLLTAKYIVHDHCDCFFPFLSSNSRILFNLWHGMPIKAIGQLDKGLTTQSKKNYQYMAKHSYMFVISDIYKIILSSLLGMSPNKIFITGQARTDVMFYNQKMNEVIEKLKLDASKKIVIYTPTYKKRSKNEDVQTQYDNIFYLKDYSDKDFVDFLEINNICFVIKPHPFEQTKFKKNIEESILLNNSNIRILYNDDFVKNNFMLNQIFPISSLMISDFSSVSIDYAMLNKPILYLNNYTQSYKKGRGLILPDNYKILMLGESINSYSELKNKILEYTQNEKSNYSKEQVDVLHKYKDGHSCERIFEIMRGL